MIREISDKKNPPKWDILWARIAQNLKAWAVSDVACHSSFTQSGCSQGIHLRGS